MEMPPSRRATLEFVLPFAVDVFFGSQSDSDCDGAPSDLVVMDLHLLPLRRYFVDSGRQWWMVAFLCRGTSKDLIVLLFILGPFCIFTRTNVLFALSFLSVRVVL